MRRAIRRRSRLAAIDPAAIVASEGATAPRCWAQAMRYASARSRDVPPTGVSYASCSSATSLISMPITTTDSVASSTGQAYGIGRNAAAPVAAPTAAAARAARAISSSAI